MVKKEKRKHDIKSKLIAAICMLLVSTIMMVSTTYAWFTLSTAPEVTGITTAVGANGNLEIALQPLDGDSSKITSSAGDSMSVQDATIANLTWGNLIDVSKGYGMDQIMLYPSKLNTVTVTYNENSVLGLSTSPLAIPLYGSDGRVTELATNKTFAGVYNSADKGFTNSYTLTQNGNTTTISDPYGIRAVGTSSGMSDRQLAYRAALQAASTAGEQAKRYASQSLNANGASLADIAIKHATASGTETYSVTELKSLYTIVGEMEISLDYIEEALIQYALATALAKVASDDNYQNYVDAFTAESTTYANLATVMSTNTVTNAGITDNLSKLATSYTNVASAKTGLYNLLYTTTGDTTTEVDAGTTYTWEQFYPYLKLLANPDSMQVNGIKVSELKSDWTLSANEYTADDANKVNVGTTDTPVYYYKYTYNETLYYLEQKTNTTDNTTYWLVHESELDTDSTSSTYNTYPVVSNMARLVDAVLNDGLQLTIASGAGIYADIADFCGDYSAAVKLSKISYGGMTVKNLDATMQTKTTANPTYLNAASTAVGSYQAGTGSSATSNITDFYGYIMDLAVRTNVEGSYLKLQQKAADRVYTDSTNEDTMGGGASMSFTSNSEKFSATAVKSLMGCIRIVFFDTNSRAILGYAKLDESTAETDSTGKITMYIAMCDKDGNLLTGNDAVKIIDLEQNVITELSVLVYLDGEKVTNADVANAASSMTGSMNLQFASSAELKPMDYTDLKTGASSDSSSGSNTTTLTAVTVANSTHTVSNATHSGTTIAFALSDTDGTETVKVAIGSSTYDAQYTEVSGTKIWAITNVTETIAADTAITITVTENNAG